MRELEEASFLHLSAIQELRRNALAAAPAEHQRPPTGETPHGKRPKPEEQALPALPARPCPKRASAKDKRAHLKIALEGDGDAWKRREATTAAAKKAAMLPALQKAGYVFTGTHAEKQAAAKRLALKALQLVLIWNEILQATQGNGQGIPA